MSGSTEQTSKSVKWSERGVISNKVDIHINIVNCTENAERKTVIRNKQQCTHTRKKPYWLKINKYPLYHFLKKNILITL